MNTVLEKSLYSLLKYIEKNEFKGYDPYDTLNSWIPFQCLGKWGPILATQFQKRNPINIRPLLGIKKFHSTKGMGLLLSAYLKLYTISSCKDFIPKIEFLKDWLLLNTTEYKSTFSWGYDYPYATPKGKVTKGFPSVIHHLYIIRALYEYYEIFKDESIKNKVIESSGFILENIKFTNYKEGICFNYNPKSEGCCYNASLHATGCLAMVYYFSKDNSLLEMVKQSVNFVISKQKKDGSWFYGFTNNPENERKQIDFHQGFILESIFDIKELLEIHNPLWENAIKKGVTFYRDKQFLNNGRSLWRIPKIFPVDIHNQAQGIITFSKLNEYNINYLNFSKKIAQYTIENMQDKKGFFYYRNYKYYKNKIPYMRWSQSWMLLALVNLLKKV